MSSCRLQFDFTGTSQRLVEGIRTHVARVGGTFEGSDHEGSFVLSTPIGTFRGSYSITGQTLVLEVADKPFFVPCSAIEARLLQYVRESL